MKRVLAILIIIAMSFGMAGVSMGAFAEPVYATDVYAADVYATDVYAAESNAQKAKKQCEESFKFIGLRAWYAGLTELKNGKCEVKTPKNEEEIGKFVLKVVANVIADLTFIIGILTLGFVVYGGYLYILSEGDPGRVARGKSTIIRAVIGTAIALLANVIVNLFVSVLI